MRYGLKMTIRFTSGWCFRLLFIYNVQIIEIFQQGQLLFKLERDLQEHADR